MEPKEVALAREMFEAYNSQGPNPWKTFDGRDVPKWDELGEQVTAKWLAAAREALSSPPVREARAIDD